MKKLLILALCAFPVLAQADNQVYITRDGGQSIGFIYETTIIDPDPANGQISCDYADNSVTSQPGLWGAITFSNSRIEGQNPGSCFVDVRCETYKQGSMNVTVKLNGGAIGTYARRVPCKDPTGQLN